MGSGEVTFQAPGHPPQIDIGNGRTTKAPDYHLIPTIALRRLAERFALGEIRKGEKAWNAGSKFQDVLTNRAFIIERLNHVIDHAMKLRDEVNSNSFGEDDNAGAIAWAGAFLICATDAIAKEKTSQESPDEAEAPVNPARFTLHEVGEQWAIRDTKQNGVQAKFEYYENAAIAMNGMESGDMAVNSLVWGPI